MKNKFIPTIPPDKSVISIRLENEMIERIDKLSEKRNLSRNEFIRQSIVFALENLDESFDAT